MKKGYILLISIALLLSACSISNRLPDSGVWYCESLNMTIDFSQDTQDDKNVKVYGEDGTYTVYRCNIDYGRGIFIQSLDNDMYLRGKFKYTGSTFIITSTLDNKTYYFYEQNSRT